MSNYTQTTFFAPKDALLSGNPLKLIKGADVDPELNAIAVAIATKYDGLNFLSANPGSTIGLTAVNGSATTWMRSDASPALSQAIAPTWTGLHTFTNTGTFVFSGPLTTTNVAVSNNFTINASSASGGYARYQTNSIDVGYWGSGNRVFSGSASDFAITSVGNNKLSLGSNSLERIGITGTGNIVVNAPTSGNALTVNQSTTSPGLVVSGSGTIARIFDTGAHQSVIDINATNTKNILNFSWLTTATPAAIQVGAVDVIGLSTTGNITINAPSVGNALVVNGAASSYAAQVTAPNSTGQSFGFAMQAGTNSSDFTARLVNAANTLVYFSVRGDGVVQLPGGTQPMFNAQRVTSAQTLANSSVSAAVFNGNNTNQSNSYSTSTGIFTAPVLGVYVFNAELNILAGNTPTNLVLNAVYFSRNASTTIGGNRYDIPIQSAPNTLGQNATIRVGGSVTLVLAAGDTLRVNLDVGAPNGTTTTNVDVGSYFSGYLLG